MPYNYFDMGAAQGRAVGQGLMGLAQGVSGAMEKHKKDALAKATAKINLVLKMADGIPDDADKTTYIMGNLGEEFDLLGLDEKARAGITVVFAKSKEARARFGEMSQPFLDKLTKRDFEGARKDLNTMSTEFGKFPWAKDGIKGFQKEFDKEEAYQRGKTDKGEERIFSGQGTTDEEGNIIPKSIEQKAEEGRITAGIKNIGQTRTIQRGLESVTERWDGEKWEEVARGPKFKPGKEGDKVTFEEKTRIKLLEDTYKSNQDTINKLKIERSKEGADRGKINKEITYLVTDNERIQKELQPQQGLTAGGPEKSPTPKTPAPETKETAPPVKGAKMETLPNGQKAWTITENGVKKVVVPKKQETKPLPKYFDGTEKELYDISDAEATKYAEEYWNLSDDDKIQLEQKFRPDNWYKIRMEVNRIEREGKGSKRGFPVKRGQSAGPHGGLKG